LPIGTVPNDNLEENFWNRVDNLLECLYNTINFMRGQSYDYIGNRDFVPFY